MRCSSDSIRCGASLASNPWPVSHLAAESAAMPGTHCCPPALRVFFKQPKAKPTSNATPASKRHFYTKGLKPWDQAWSHYSNKRRGGAEPPGARMRSG